MKIGLCTWSYHKSFESGGLDLPGLMQICAQDLKVGGIDIIADHLPRTDTKSILGYKHLAAQLHLSIACLSPGNNFGKPSAGERGREVKAIEKWLEIGYTLGTPVLRIFSGWPWPYRDRDKLWPEMVRCIRICERAARSRGIVLAIEPHNDGGFLPTAVETMRLIREIDSPWVRINLDTGNYQDADNYKAIEETIAYAPHIHAKVHRIGEDGLEKVFDFPRIFSIIRDANYRGFISLEFEGQDFFGQDEATYVPKAVAMLKEYAKRYAF